MGDVSYLPLISDMVWSHSRIKAFEDCPYKWYLKYICEYREEDTFFASYGSFIHKLIEQYYSGELKQGELPAEYVTRFRTEVKGNAPSAKVWRSYFDTGMAYMNSFKPFPFKLLSVEEQVRFTVGDREFVGYIDFLGEDGDELVIVDHKSRTLKPRSKRAKPTKADRELDEYLRQQYLYAEAIRQKYGRYPKKLCFNIFRSDLLIQEDFEEQACEGAKTWALDGIARISKEEDFRPSVEFFRCNHLCGVNHLCEYYELLKG